MKLKKCLVLLLSLSMLLAIAGCGKKAEIKDDPVATYSPAPTFYKLSDCLTLGKYKDVTLSWDSESGKTVLNRHYASSGITKPTEEQTASIQRIANTELLWQTIMDSSTVKKAPAELVTFFGDALDLQMQKEMENSSAPDFYSYLQSEYALNRSDYPTYKQNYAEQQAKQDMVVRAIALAEKITYTANDVSQFAVIEGLKYNVDGAEYQIYFGRDLTVSQMMYDKVWKYVQTLNKIS